MFLIRLILLLLAAVVVRRLVRRAFAPPARRADPPRTAERGDPRYRDLSGQEISDADFEEIP